MTRPAGGVFDPSAAPRDQSHRRAAPGARWRSPAGLVMLAATGLALAIRFYLLDRPGYLTGITEYDDGVYLGGAISLISGTLPYRDFAFVQPPGILLLMAPVAMIAKVSAVTSAMAAARLLTAAASAGCVWLAGSLIRHRGTTATLVACGALALYPDDIMSAHTLLLEPWMNLLVLSGGCVAFRDGTFRGGRPRGPRWPLYAGVLFGLAVAVKYWAAIPAACMIGVYLIAGPGDSLAVVEAAADADQRATGPGNADTGAGGTAGNGTWFARTGSTRTGSTRVALARAGSANRALTLLSGARAGRAAWFSAGLAAGFTVPVLPFAARWPAVFLRSTVLDQASRTGSAVSESLRLAHLTGLAAVLNDAGRLTASGNEGTLFARADVTAGATWATGWLPVALAVIFAVLLGLGYAAGRTRPGHAQAGPAGMGQARASHASTGPSAGQGSADQGKAGHGSAERGSAGPGRSGPGNTGLGGGGGRARERAVRAGRGDPGTWAGAAPGGAAAIEVYALAVLGCTLAAVLGYSAFFYHYADLPAPWLAIAAGYAVAAWFDKPASGVPLPALGEVRDSSFASARSRRSRWQRGTRVSRHHRNGLVTGLAVGLALVAAFEAWELSGSRAPSVSADAALIPPGACVVSDEISLTIAAQRFTAGSAGCPDVLDSLAATLVSGDGVSVEGGARALPRVTTAWLGIFARARYVWLSGSSGRRIPWTSGMRAWFARNFKPLNPPAGQHGEGQLYLRRA